FRHPVHEVARIVPPVECHIQLLVMAVDFILEVKLEMSRGEDDGLAHQEKEDAANERQQQHQGAKQQQTVPENFVDQLLPLESVEEPVHADVLLDQIEGDADNLGGKHPEVIGYDDENNTGNHSPAVFVKVLIEMREVFHMNRGQKYEMFGV